MSGCTTGSLAPNRSTVGEAAGVMAGWEANRSTCCCTNEKKKKQMSAPHNLKDMPRSQYLYDIHWKSDKY